jgi:uncharacterized protein
MWCPAGYPARTFIVQKGKTMSNFDRNANIWGQTGTRVGAAEYDLGLRAYMLGIYNHMTLALGISALVAWGTFMAAVTSEPTAYRIAQSMYLTDLGAALYLSPLKWVVMLAPLGFVMFMSFKVESTAYHTLLTMFWAFSAVMGLSLSTVFLVFKIGSVVQVLFLTAATFGALSLYGYTTKRSLSAMGSFMMMGLFGIIIAGIVNIFLESSALQFGLNVLGILIFAGLTAWDTQRLKEDYDYVAGDSELVGKASVMGALTLYLDFINMFQMLLQLFGQRNND